MSFTDLWRCKGCQTLPDIQVRGKNFLIECARCQGRRSFANSLDEVVAMWNRKNDPLKKKGPLAGLIADLRELPQRVKDFVTYEYQRRSFRPAPAVDDEDAADDAISTGTAAQGSGTSAMTAE